jgi:hypothetical protein
MHALLLSETETYHYSTDDHCVIDPISDQSVAASTTYRATPPTDSPRPLLDSIQYNPSNNTRLRSTPTMSHIPLNNVPLHARPVNKRLRRLRRKSPIQHRLEPNPASIECAFGPEGRQDWSRDALLRVRDVCLRERFLLGGVGVVEEVGDDGVEDEEARCRLYEYIVRTPSW